VCISLDFLGAFFIQLLEALANVMYTFCELFGYCNKRLGFVRERALNIINGRSANGVNQVRSRRRALAGTVVIPQFIETLRCGVEGGNRNLDRQ